MNDSQPLIGTASQTIWLPPLMDQLQEKVEQPNGEPPKNKNFAKITNRILPTLVDYF